VSHHRHLSTTVRLSAAVAVIGCSMLAVASPALAGGTSQFTPGDLVVYETQGISSNAQAVSLVDYSTTVPNQVNGQINLPTVSSGSTHALTESGGALNDGELTLSADGQSLIATGYNAPVGTASVTSATNTPRTVALVSANGVDTSTSLVDSPTETQNFRSATTAVTGGNIYVGSGSGTGITTDGATGATYLTGDKVHEVLVSNGQLYESTTKNIFSIGTGLPTSGSPTTVALLSGANLPANFGPDQFAFVRLESGTGPADTLYVADGSNGATSGDPNLVEKYSLVSGVWTATGSITVPLVVGLAASASGGVAQLYVTGATSSSAGNNTILDSITDSSGFDQTMTGTATLLDTAPSGTDFKGLVILPAGFPAIVPEFRYPVLLPIAGAVLAGGFLAIRHRRRTAATAAV
jgi:hypothetical protein